MNDEEATNAETIRQGEALANGGQFSDVLSEYLASDAWDSPYEAMQILCGLYPSQELDDGFQFFDSCIEQQYENRCEVLRLGMPLRRLKETLEKMSKRWSSGSHPQRPSPEYYLQWAILHGFDVPWLDAAEKLGLVSKNILTPAKPVPAESPPEIPDGEDIRPTEPFPSKQMRKSAMVKMLGRVWPSIENDLKEASRTDLQKAHPVHTYWDVEIAMKWAWREGKLVRENKKLEDLRLQHPDSVISSVITQLLNRY